MDDTIRTANVAVLVKLETTPGVDANPDPTVDAIPVETDSITRNSPWTTEQSNEANGSYVAGNPMVVGQAASIGFRSRIKGAGAGATYSSTVKPPLHQALQACGMRGRFQAAIATALASAGGATSATLAAGFPGTDRSLIGMPLVISAGVGVGATPLVAEYTAARVATLTDSFAPALDATSSIAIPANWTYAGTSPADATARATDHPTATVYIYRDGVLWKYVGCRGVLALDGKTARPGFAGFTFSGIFAGRVDAAVPTNLVVASHMAPVLVQGSGVSPAVLLNRKPIAISTWSLDAGSQASSPEDPNTNYGFGQGQLAGRTPMFKVDPLATQVATRDSIAEIGAGTEMTGALRHGSVAGNRWSLTLPRLQKTAEEDGTRDQFVSEQLTAQALSLGRDSATRDTDRILCFS